MPRPVDNSGTILALLFLLDIECAIVYTRCMDPVYLVNFAVSLVVGILGGLIASWSSYRYQLVLDQRQKAMETMFDDRLNQIQKIVTRQDKTAAVTARWEKNKKADEKLIEDLTTAPVVQQKLHPWDPRLWGKD